MRLRTSRRGGKKEEMDSDPGGVHHGPSPPGEKSSGAHNYDGRFWVTGK